MAEYTDLELITLWQQGNDVAFDSLYKRYAFWLTDMAVRKIQDKNAAYDLMQDVMLDVYLRKDKLQIHSDFKAYLFISLRNRVFQYKRKQLEIRFSEELDMLTLNDDVTEYIGHKELWQKAQHAIAHLPKQCKKVFELRRNHNLSNKKIADEMGISENTVEQHMRKALKLLRSQLKMHNSILILSILEYFR